VVSKCKEAIFQSEVFHPYHAIYIVNCRSELRCVLRLHLNIEPWSRDNTDTDLESLPKLKEVTVGFQVDHKRYIPRVIADPRARVSELFEFFNSASRFHTWHCGSERTCTIEEDLSNPSRAQVLGES
jgi:hypothetical protein